MFQSFLEAKTNTKLEEEEPEETITRKVRIVVTNGKHGGAAMGDGGGNVAQNDNQDLSTRTESLFSLFSGNMAQKDKQDLGARTESLFSLFSTSTPKPDPVEQPENIVAIEEADDGSVEAGLEELRGQYYDSQDPLSKYDNVEVQPKPRAKLLSIFSSKKLVEKEDIISVEKASDDVSVEDIRKKYDVNALRVPSVLDQEEGNVELGEEEEEEDEILKDPYSEIGPLKEPMMVDEEEEEVNEDERREKKRFMMALTSKVFFLLGSLLFLMLAVHDYQRLKRSQPPQNLDQTALKEQASVQDVLNQTETIDATVESTDDDVDPFVVTEINTADAEGFEEEMESAEAQKEERTGGALYAWSVQETGTRRRAQTTNNWYTQYWEDLPDDIKEFAALLGYDQYKWDRGDSVYTDRLYWHQLTPKQQNAAAKVFGYTQETWNDYVTRFLDKLEDSPAPSPSPTDKPIPAPNEDKPIPAPNEDRPVPAPNENNQSGQDAPNEDPMGGVGGSEHQTHETEGGNEDGEEGAGSAGDQGADEIKGTQAGTDGDAPEDDSNSVSAFTVDTAGPSQSRGSTFMAFYLCAAICFVFVGIFDALHQQLAFHTVMVLAGVTGVMAGAFSTKNESAFNICHSISSHFFLLQAVLVVYSRLLLTYDTPVRRVLNFADGLFSVGALMNIVISYMQYNETTPAMTKTSLSASVFWCVAAVIYVAVTVMFWLRRRQAWQTSTASCDFSIADSCKVDETGGGGCEISLGDANRRK